MNPTATIYRSEKSKIDIESLLNIYAFDLDAKLEIDPEFLLEEHDHEHDDEVGSIVLREDRPLDLDKVNEWIGEWVTERGTEIFRYKGILQIADWEERVVLQGVHMLFGAEADRPWQDGERRTSEVVLIGRNLDHQWFQEQFEKCVAGC
jgi:G3E family GTPase